MPNFYVSKLLYNSGIYRADTTVYGEVEIRPPQSDYADEQKVIEESILSSKIDIKQEFTCRIGTIVCCESQKESEVLADERFISVLDLLSAEYLISHIAVAQCGIIKNLDTGDISPIVSHQLNPGTIFVRRNGNLQKYEFNHWIHTQKTELAECYKRSIHWSRNARWDKSIHVKILYHWFAIEALFKQDVNDDISSLLLLHLGFPGSTYARNISRDLLKILDSNTSYMKWKKTIRAMVDDIRVFRNNSVHSGFRNIDFSKEKIRLYNNIMLLGCSRSQAAVKTALANKITTVDEFKEYSGIIFENRENLIGDIIGTIIFNLENDYMKDIEHPYV